MLRFLWAWTWASLCKLPEWGAEDLQAAMAARLILLLGLMALLFSLVALDHLVLQ